MGYDSSVGIATLSVLGRVIPGYCATQNPYINTYLHRCTHTFYDHNYYYYYYYYYYFYYYYYCCCYCYYYCYCYC